MRQTKRTRLRSEDRHRGGPGYWVASSLCAWLVVLHAGCTETDVRHNVVLIVVDTLRADALSYNGHVRETSPRLDALAKESIVFSNAFSGGTNTSTAMGAIMTGRLSFYSENDLPCMTADCESRWNARTQYGLHRFYEGGEKGVPLALDTLAEMLDRDGYRTAGIVTNPFLKKEFQADQGFEIYREVFRPEYPIYGAGDDVTAAAVEFLSEGADRPFFLYVHYMEPHAPYFPADEYKRRFVTESIGPDDSELFEQWQAKVHLPEVAPEKLKSYVRGLYDAEVASVDAAIGKLIEALKRVDAYENTVIAVTADHGEEFWEHGRTGHPGRFYDEHVRVPLMIKAPRLDPGEIPALVRNFDVMPTLLELVGTAFSPRAMDGVSLVPLMRSRSSDPGLATYATMPYPVTRRMLRDSRYKLVVHVENPERNALYDLKEDPGENVNLYSEQAYEGVRVDLEGRLNALVDKLRAEGPLSNGGSTGSGQELDEETLRQLRALGYIK